VLFDARERLPRPDLSNLLRLRILTTADFPPFNFADQTGRLTGFNIDLAREICLELKIESRCQIQALPFEELEEALANGNGDAVMAGVAVTAERRESFSFSRPYLMIPARFARHADRDLGELDENALAARTVGVVNRSAHEAMLKAFFPRAIPVLFTDQNALLDALKDNKVAAVFSDGLRLPFWIAGEASANCCRLYGGPYFSETFLGEGVTVMLKKDDDTLRDAFDHALGNALPATAACRTSTCATSRTGFIDCRSIFLLACPSDPSHPFDLCHVEGPVRMVGIERGKLNAARGLPQQHLGHHLAIPGLHHDAVSAANLRAGFDDQHVPVAVERHHGIALDLQSVDASLPRRGGRKIHHVPALAGREAAIVEEAAGASLREAEQRDRTGLRRKASCRDVGSCLARQ
jgi:polar amino acid transport system substrate-binding protein